MTDLPQQAIYDHNVRGDVAVHIPTAARSVLDVGCSRGGFGSSIRSRLGPSARLVGIEAVPSQAEAARASGFFDEVITGYFPQAMPTPHERFDLLSFNDVLEHMLEPEDVLRQVHTYLNPGGHVLATIPNVQYAPVVYRLMRGRWDYTDTGVLDRTHVRFFTRATMVEMFERAGYVVLECNGINSVARHWQHNPLRRAITQAAAHLLGDAQWLQFAVLARTNAITTGG